LTIAFITGVASCKEPKNRLADPKTASDPPSGLNPIPTLTQRKNGIATVGAIGRAIAKCL
jgi:hypothetical protein